MRSAAALADARGAKTTEEMASELEALCRAAAQAEALAEQATAQAAARRAVRAPQGRWPLALWPLHELIDASLCSPPGDVVEAYPGEWAAAVDAELAHREAKASVPRVEAASLKAARVSEAARVAVELFTIAVRIHADRLESKRRKELTLREWEAEQAAHEAWHAEHGEACPQYPAGGLADMEACRARYYGASSRR